MVTDAPGLNLDTEAGFAALGVRNAVGRTGIAGVLGQFRGTGAGGGIDEIKMDEFAEPIQITKSAFINDVVVLVARHAAAQPGPQERIIDR